MASPSTKKYFAGAAALALAAAVSAAELEIRLAPKFAGEDLQPASLRYETSAHEKFSVTRVSFLLSGFALQRADGSWLELTNAVAWFDFESGRLAHRLPEIPAGDYASLRFHVGLDEKLNRADPAAFPVAHPLNPNLNGLHWSWQGGYIFLALEGLWRDAAGALDGWAYHLAREPNRTAVTLAAPLPLTNALRLHLDFDLAALLNAPHPLAFARDGVSTHSRTNDPIALALVANLPSAFRVRLVESAAPENPRPANVQPLFLPAKFTPFRFQMSATFPIPDLPRDNPLIEERVILGEKLFSETALSRDGSLACASCHKRAAAFADPRRFSVGVRDQTGTRHAMPLFNLAWKSSFFWDGRAPSLRAQALMPIQDHTEMDESLTNVCAKLAAKRAGLPLTSALSPREREKRSQSPDKSAAVGSSKTSRKSEMLRKLSPLPEGEGQGEGKRNGLQPVTGNSTDAIDYPALFGAAFGSPEITPEKIGLALEQFLLTLTSFDSRFDRVMRGAETFAAAEQRGFELFMTEFEPRTGRRGADCFHCHGGPLFQSQTFANNGLDFTFTDPGRAKITGKDSDAGKFATPSLRNIALTAPYMHDGRFATLEEVIGHYTTGMKRSATLDPNLAKHPDGGVPLSAADRSALVAFLKTLTDARFSGKEIR